MLSGKRIVLGVTGGIAAYKAVFLLREFQKKGAEVRVTLTPAATRFVGIETFASLSGHGVAVEIFPENTEGNDWTRHISWGEWADLFVIAPCTANTIAKITNGMADNMLTSTVLAARCPILICPTMDGEMYEAPAVSQNLRQLEKNGYHILEPETGFLASGLQGKGRLPEIEKILEKSSEIIGSIEGPLSGRKVVVTAGSTREFIDPVRFISNPSSGKMGFAMAEAAQSLGAEVTLIHGAVSAPVPENIRTEKIVSAQQLFEAVKLNSHADIIIMAAAVSDFTPQKTYGHKVKKSTTDTTHTIELKRTTDILEWLGQNKREGQLLIGFAMETEDLENNARKKLSKKNADWIIGNLLSNENPAFQSDENTVLLIGKETSQKFKGPKKDIAIEVLNRIFRKKS